MGQIIRFPAPTNAPPGPSAKVRAPIDESECAERARRTILLAVQDTGIAPEPFEGVGRLFFAARRRLIRRRPAAIPH